MVLKRSLGVVWAPKFGLEGILGFKIVPSRPPGLSMEAPTVKSLVPRVLRRERKRVLEIVGGGRNGGN